MVILKKISFSNEEVVYEYYPEGKTEFPGIIAADLKERKVFLKESSQKDFYQEILGVELNDMRDSINKMRVENGEEPYTEEEFPACDPDKDYGGYVYAEKALSKLAEFFEANDFRDEGMVAWY
ncbi:hypothetical protein [Peptococcus niger]|uniref:Uncharacterized protein n=1 Tax=Peptococcus niger TaxID=2741 RepID=A0A1G7A690_PEPNI|nr:hypothetical protein [Peptococcus niger]SDE10332.1 hypothetical protein SAMN04489866_11910 [Peptococcus niger]